MVWSYYEHFMPNFLLNMNELSPGLNLTITQLERCYKISIKTKYPVT